MLWLLMFVLISFHSLTLSTLFFHFQDKLIADFIPRVIPTVQQSLNTTKQRLAILPGGAGMMDTVRALSDVQEALRRKVGQQ